MRMSQRLQKTQAELDFVDIDTTQDAPLYLDPQLIAASPHPFAESCNAVLSGFFRHFLTLLRNDKAEVARALFSHLHEPNETCLGQSQGNPSGRGIGSEQANQLFESIRNSRAAESGILEELEDCAVFIPGIGGDKVSDMTTNVIRGQLILYTQKQCDLHDLPLRADTVMGPVWNSELRRWDFVRTGALVIDERPILLVPKNFVSYAKSYTIEKFHRHFVLEFIKKEQLRTNGPFVRRYVRRNGTERIFVVKKELQEEIAPLNKDWVTGFTEANAVVFQNFKDWARKKAIPLSNGELRGGEDIPAICNFLLDTLVQMPSGPDHASEYHRLMLGVLELMFYPTLTNPYKEREIHEGRKRIDLCFDNAAKRGVFLSLHQLRGLPCPYIMVECKNYGREVGNPEIDQLSGRFSPNRGQVGLLLFRSVENRDRLINRCRDTYRDSRGLILPISDEDMLALLRSKQEAPLSRPEEEVLDDLCREIILA